MWALYEALYILGYLAYLPNALRRKRIPHPGWRMRLGYYADSLGETLEKHPSIWLHAVSVGEFLAARPLMDAFYKQYSQFPLVCSSVTPGGFELAQRHVKDKGIPIYFPMDLKGPINRALTQWQPRLMILMESEIWPNMLHQAQQRKLPVVVVNGRVSDRSFARAQKYQKWVSPVLKNVSQFLMQSDQDAERVLALGVDSSRVTVTGNLKWDASVMAAPDEETVQALRHELGLVQDDWVCVAGSTHEGEETILMEVLQKLKANAPKSIRMILAPRHLERLEVVEKILHKTNLRFRRFSQKGADDWDVLLVDVFGKMPLFYGLADCVYIGGSLIPHGGQNPLEATTLGKPVVFGPHMHNFSDITQQLISGQAARQVQHGEELFAVLSQYLQQPEQSSQMAEKAKRLSQKSLGATDKTLDVLSPYLIKTGP